MERQERDDRLDLAERLRAHAQSCQSISYSVGRAGLLGLRDELRFMSESCRDWADALEEETLAGE